MKDYYKNSVMARSDPYSEEGGDQFLNNLFKSATNGDIDMD